MQTNRMQLTPRPVAAQDSCLFPLPPHDRGGLAGRLHHRHRCGSAREVVWMQAAETGAGIPAARVSADENFLAFWALAPRR